LKIKEDKIYTLVPDSIRLNGERSVNTIKVLVDEYTQVKECPKYFSSPIIHLYAKKDTYDECGNLNGYSDSLFFECHVYDTINGIVYKSDSLHDSFACCNAKPNQIRVFKDGSTLISFLDNVQIGFKQTITAYKFMGNL